jgi:ABC-type antimicrobial peptide transport system permease subunit
MDRSVPVFDDRTVDDVVREAASRRRVAAIMLSVFAGAALVLAVIGLYGVIAQSVSERRREIGVQMALGATGGQILGLFLRHGLIVVALGIASGVVAAVAQLGALPAWCSASPSRIL